MRYTLRDEGYPFLKIYAGKKWIGRVFKHVDGRWVGMIGKNSSRIEATADSKEAAFRAVASRAMGYADAEALAARNAAVRRKNRATKEAARFVVGEMLHGNYEPFHQLLTKGKL